VLLLVVVAVTVWWTRARDDGLVGYSGTMAGTAIRLEHPERWARHERPDRYVLFSPLDLGGLFSGQPGVWSQVTQSLATDPGQAVGLYVGVAGASNLYDVRATRVGVETSLRGSRVGWDDIVTDEPIAGHPARTMTGVVRPPNGTTALRFRAHVVQVDDSGATVLQIIFFAPSDLFQQQGERFDRVRASLEVGR